MPTTAAPATATAVHIVVVSALTDTGVPCTLTIDLTAPMTCTARTDHGPAHRAATTTHHVTGGPVHDLHALAARVLDVVDAPTVRGTVDDLARAIDFADQVTRLALDLAVNAFAARTTPRTTTRHLTAV